MRILFKYLSDKIITTNEIDFSEKNDGGYKIMFSDGHLLYCVSFNSIEYKVFCAIKESLLRSGFCDISDREVKIVK